MRWAMVASGTRNARAISAVVRPQSTLSASAVRASVDSTGWHAVKTRRSRSSPKSGPVSTSISTCCRWPSSRPISSCLRSSRWSRRSRSIARCLAVDISQAPGFGGTPASGHFSRAMTSASCASSSARPTSPTIRASPAISRAASIRQTASMARCVSETVTAPSQLATPVAASRISRRRPACAIPRACAARARLLQESAPPPRNPPRRTPPAR